MRKPEKPKNKRSRTVCPVRKFGIARRQNMLDMFQAVLRDIQNINPRYRSVDSARDFKTISIRLEHEGLGFISVILPNLMSDLFAYLETGIPSYTGWKLKPGTKYPAFLGRLFEEVHEAGDHQALSFAHIYQICVLFKKLKGPFKKDVLRDMSRKFINDDYRLGMVDLMSEPVEPIINNARKIIETVFKDVDLSPGYLLPKPGPGATNTPVDKNLRFRPHRFYTSLDEEFDYLEYFYSHSWDPFEDARRYMNLPIMDQATSRFKWVHKYLGKPRGICIEENEMQFFQQAVKRFLYDWLESHPWTRGKVNFTDQSINQGLALNSSVSGDMVTLDMSSASNMVSRELVFRLFWNTSLTDILDTLSTRIIEMSVQDELGVDMNCTREIYTNMFAPMGSGVCFPVMAIVHWALVCSIIKLSSIDDSSNLSKQVYVYGDDIIFPSSAKEAVFTYLPLFGMKINTDKSFGNGPFRESCGIHAYNGVDVTPVYVNHITSFNQDKRDTSTLLSLIAKEDLFFKKGFDETSQCIQKQVRKHYFSLPTVGRASPVLGFIRDGRSDYNHVAKWSRTMRYNSDLQILEFNLQCVVPSGDDPAPFPGADGYLRNQLTTYRQSTHRRMPVISEDQDQVRPGGIDELTVRRRWISETQL